MNASSMMHKQKLKYSHYNVERLLYQVQQKSNKTGLLEKHTGVVAAHHRGLEKYQRSTVPDNANPHWGLY